MTLRTVGIKLLADVAGYMSGMGRASAATKDFAGELNRAAKGGRVEEVTRATAALGVGLTGIAVGAVKMSMDFEKSMSAVKAATHASAGEIEQLRKAAISAGQDTQFSATQAADGITELSKAGVSTANVLGGGLKGALDLAAAGQISVAEAAETSASAMTQFNLSGDRVPHVADLLAAAAGKAQGSVHDIGQALNQAGLVASQFGISIEDTTGVLAEFANAGLIGSDAGTSFKTMLLAMANPSGVTRDRMNELGISFYDAQGKFIGLSGVAQTLQTKLRGLTEEERNAALGQIFGNDAIRAASILYKDGAQGVQKWSDAVNDTGYASKTASTLTDNLAGDLERLKGSLETLAIQSGGGASEGLRKLAQGANSAVDAFSNLPGFVQQTITMASGIGGVSLIAAAGFLKMRGTAKDLMDELRDMGPRGTAAATGLGKIAGVAGKLGLVGAAAVGVYEGFRLFSDWADKRTGPTKANIDKLTESIKQFAESGKATGELASKYGDSLQRIGKDVAAVTKGMEDLKKMQDLTAQGLADPSLGENWNPIDPQVTQRVKDLDAALTALVKSGGAPQAAIFLRELQASGGMTAEQFTKLTTLLPNYTAAAGSATLANGGLAKGFGTAQANAQTLKVSMEEATGAGEKLTDVWNQLHGALLGTDKAMLAANQSIDAVKKSFKDNGKAIDGNSSAALRNRIAVGEAAKAAADSAQAKFEETGSVKEANRVYGEHIKQLRKALIATGLDDAAVEKLIGSYGRMPDDVATRIAQPGIKEALSKTQDLWNKLQGVDGNWVARINTTGYADTKDKLLGLLAAQKSLRGNQSIAETRRELSRFMAAGGPVRGAGGPTSDDIPAWLSNGEHVWTAAEVAALGGQAAVVQLRAAVLSGKRVEVGDETPGFARGGAVVMPFPFDVSKTKIPELNFGSAPRGGQTYRWIESVVRAAFPGLRVISDFRPGAVTLSGNRSYHSVGRAVDYPASRPLAEWFNLHFMRQIKELITPWNSLNIYNGSRHTYTGAVWNQHNFAGGNAHDHVAFAHGGTIAEPIFGIGASGRTYSFGENYHPERVTANWQSGAGGNGGGTFAIHLVNHGVIGSRTELDDWLTGAVDRLRRRGRV